MSISLTKNQTISLTKENSGLHKISMGLGWDCVQTEKKSGFLANLFSSESSGDIDLDASCICMDENKNLVESVSFMNLSNRNESIVHTGDNLTGEGDGDDETIEVDLLSVPPKVKHLVFTVNSFRGQTFDKVKNAFCRIVDLNSGREIAKYDLSCQGNHTGQIMARVSRNEDGHWVMQALGSPSQGRTFDEMVPHVKTLF